MENRLADMLATDQETRKPTESPISPSSSDHFGDTLRRQLGRPREMMEGFIASHPVICLTAALTAGVSLGWWIKRK